MRLPALALLTAAGCATTPDPYTVDAIAPLAPVATPAGAAAAITGPIEVLGTGVPVHGAVYTRTFAAYKVHLAEGVAPWVRIYDAPSCDPPADPRPVIADLGEIRRVGGETHFFARGVQVGDRTLDIDTGTAPALVPVTVTLDPPTDPVPLFNYVVGKPVVVQLPGDGTVPGPGPGGVPGIGPPLGGPWLSCGVIELR